MNLEFTFGVWSRTRILYTSLKLTARAAVQTFDWQHIIIKSVMTSKLEAGLDQGLRGAYRR